MFLRETLLRGPAPGHRDYQAVTVSGVSPGPGVAPQIPGDIGHERRSEHRERDSGEREGSQGEEKRAVSLRYCLVRTGAREAPGARDT